MLFSNANNDPSAELGTKELQKLRRQDLLEFLLDQMVENDTLRDTLAEREASIRDLSSMAERLKAKLDDKDATIERLKKRLDIKDKMIAELMAQGRELPRSDGLFDMAELLEVEERAVEAYINSEHEAHEEAAAAKNDGPTGDEPEGEAS